MEILYYICIILSAVFSFCNSVYYYYYGEESKKRTWNFIVIKGVLYLFLAIVTMIFTFWGEESSKLVGMSSVCIALFEASQNILQGKAEKFKMKMDLELKERKMGDLRKIELLEMFCREKLETLEGNNSSANKQLIYEQLYDYLKYYEGANKLFIAYKEYEEGKKNLDNILDIENAFFEDFKMECIEIVKMPNS